MRPGDAAWERAYDRYLAPPDRPECHECHEELDENGACTECGAEQWTPDDIAEARAERAEAQREDW